MQFFVPYGWIKWQLRDCFAPEDLRSDKLRKKNEEAENASVTEKVLEREAVFARFRAKVEDVLFRGKVASVFNR